jgi:DNA-binding GntR family transcriptional regulator
LAHLAFKHREGVPLGVRQVRRSTVQERVREAIEDLIVFGKLAPGERLAEVALAQQLGVSRQPVREALHTLAGFGFVDVVPGRGVSARPDPTRSARGVPRAGVARGQ